MPDPDGHLRLDEGEYGINPLDGKWYGRPPGQHMGSLVNHQVTEHEDGTITVHPSILITGYEGNQAVEWHGYLEHGVWRKC